MRALTITAITVLTGISAYCQTNCVAPSTFEYIDINNVKATIWNDGTMFSNTDYNPGYLVPKDSLSSALYVNSLFLSALDVNDSIRVSAMEFGQCNDFYSGPISTNGGFANDTTCNQFDRVWNIYRWQIEEFIQKWNQPGYEIPEAILTWPAHGDVTKGQSYFLAPFHDNNGDNWYNPYDGDYPEIDVAGILPCNEKLLGDQFIYTIINDTGNERFEFGGDSLGVEIHIMAFSYVTDDANDYTTFYRYRIINRSQEDLHDVYAGFFTDTDVGCSEDDYVGTEVLRGIAYGYNGDNYDENCNGAYGYGHPSIIGLDYVDGPIVDNDALDNDLDGVVDNPGEKLQLTVSRYSNRPPFGSPLTWTPQTAMEVFLTMRGYWNDGTPQMYDTSTTIQCPFIFPGTSDTVDWHCTGGIDPGYTWDETTWPNSPGDRRIMPCMGPFNLDAGAEEYFTIGIVWAQDTTKDNFGQIEALQAADDEVQVLADNCYQTGCVTPRPNFVYTANGLNVSFDYPYQANTFNWDFGDGNTSTDRFPDHTYSTYGLYNVCIDVSNACGMASVCIEIDIEPHQVLNGVHLKRIEGTGNEDNWLELSENSVTEILTGPDYYSTYPVYLAKNTPVDISVYDPSSVVGGTYTIAFDHVDTTASWKLWLNGGIDTVYSAVSIGTENHQYIPMWGLVVSARQSHLLTYGSNTSNAILGTLLKYDNPSQPWLTGVPDLDIYSDQNWIGAGMAEHCVFDYWKYDDYIGVNNAENYEELFGGWWSPYMLVRDGWNWPISQEWATTRNMQDLSDCPSIDLVFTSDNSKWTRCAVVEMQSDPAQAIGGAQRNELRASPSVGKDGLPDGTGNGMSWFPGYAIDVEKGERLNIAFGENSKLISEHGADMVWNPTATLYNSLDSAMFGGMHYIYIFRNQADVFGSNWMPRYDEGVFLESHLTATASTTQQRYVWRSCVWVGMPLLEQGQSLLSNEATVKIRIGKVHDYLSRTTPTINGQRPLYEFEINPATVDVDEKVALFNVDAYPNPFSEQTLIRFDNPNNELFEAYVHDLHGKLIWSDKAIVADQFMLDAILSDGVYFCTLRRNANGTSVTIKLVVNR